MSVKRINKFINTIAQYPNRYLVNGVVTTIKEDWGITQRDTINRAAYLNEMQRNIEYTVSGKHIVENGSDIYIVVIDGLEDFNTSSDDEFLVKLKVKLSAANTREKSYIRIVDNTNSIINTYPIKLIDENDKLVDPEPYRYKRNQFISINTLKDSTMIVCIDTTSYSGGFGTQGESAYEIAKRLDPTIGTESEWILSLQGKDGISSEIPFEVSLEEEDNDYIINVVNNVVLSRYTRYNYRFIINSDIEPGKNLKLSYRIDDVIVDSIIIDNITEEPLLSDLYCKGSVLDVIIYEDVCVALNTVSIFDKINPRDDDYITSMVEEEYTKFKEEQNNG